MFITEEHDMTSTADHRPPLQAVYPRQHDDRATWPLDRQRFAAFLTAKDLVLGYTRTATEGAPLCQPGVMHRLVRNH